MYVYIYIYMMLYAWGEASAAVVPPKLSSAGAAICVRWNGRVRVKPGKKMHCSIVATCLMHM